MHFNFITYIYYNSYYSNIKFWQFFEGGSGVERMREAIRVGKCQATDSFLLL